MDSHAAPLYPGETSMRVVAVGNHRAGYRGMIEWAKHLPAPGPMVVWWCPHLHPETGEARDCVRRSLQLALMGRSPW